VRLRSK